MDKKPRDKFDLDKMDEQIFVASANECTGLISVPPENEWEKEAYCELYDVPRRCKEEK